MDTIIVLWILGGSIGTGVLWWDDVLFTSRLDRQPRQLCPSPRGMLLMLIGIVGGIATLIVAIICMLIDGEMLKGTWWTESFCDWWTRPICKRK